MSQLTEKNVKSVQNIMLEHVENILQANFSHLWCARSSK
jgi:hypothetical protein